MKKIISTVVALALAAVMATAAFAANTGYTKEELKAKAAVQAQKYGVSADAANQVIDALTEDQAKALDLDVMQAAVEEAAAAVSGTNNKTNVVNAVNKAVDSIQKELTRVGATVEVGTPEISLKADGTVEVKAPVTVNGASVTVAGAGKAQAQSGSSSESTGTTTSGAAASTAGVIKATGLNTTGAAVVALAVASVLGAAAVKARKLGE